MMSPFVSLNNARIIKIRDLWTAGWVCNLANPTQPLRLEFAVGGKAVGSANASGLFYNDNQPPPVPMPAPHLLHLTFTFYLPDYVLSGSNATLAMIAVDSTTGASARFVPGAAAAAGTLQVALRPRLSSYTPTVGTGCLGEKLCPSRGDALSFGVPWFDRNPAGWSGTPAGQNLFELWNCSAPADGVDTIVLLNILPYARPAGAAAGTPGDRYHHRGWKKVQCLL